MKTSNKILLTAGLGIIIVILLPLFAIKLIITNNAGATPVEIKDTETITRQFNCSNFNEITVDGIWKLEVIKGNTHQIEISAPQNLFKKIGVECQFNKLYLKNEGSHQIDGSKVTAKITVPTLSKLKLSGFISANIQDFDDHSLSIRMHGYVNISGEGNRFHTLKLKGEGYSNIKFKGNPVTNADLHFEGMQKVELSMTGGYLIGKLEGYGKIIYDGYVRKEDIHRDGRYNIRNE